MFSNVISEKKYIHYITQNQHRLDRTSFSLVSDILKGPVDRNEHFSRSFNKIFGTDIQICVRLSHFKMNRQIKTQLEKNEMNVCCVLVVIFVFFFWSWEDKSGLKISISTKNSYFLTKNWVKKFRFLQQTLCNRLSILHTHIWLID